jgi:hypothetical protein
MIVSFKFFYGVWALIKPEIEGKYGEFMVMIKWFTIGEEMGIYGLKLYFMIEIKFELWFYG